MMAPMLHSLLRTRLHSFLYKDKNHDDSNDENVNKNEDDENEEEYHNFMQQKGAHSLHLPKKKITTIMSHLK